MPKAAEHTGAAEVMNAEAVPAGGGSDDQPPAGERITVALIPAAAGNLRRLQERTNMSKTDIANRAITTYAFFDAQLQSGHDLIVRDPQTGESQVVRFL
jgi:hypothetical protein